MPALLTVPAAVPYTGSLYPTGIANAATPPPEGPMAVNAGVQWSIDGTAILFNLAAGGSNFSQLAGVYVNNSACSEPVTLICTDTQYQLTVPAYACGWYPLYTRMLQVIGYCPSATNGDATFFQFYNSLIQSPATSSNFERGAIASIEAMGFPSAVGTAQQVMVNGPGILTAIDAVLGSVLAAAGGAFTGAVRLLDGADTLFVARFGVAQSTLIQALILFSHDGIDLPFNTNLTVETVMNGGTALVAGSVAVNALYIAR